MSQLSEEDFIFILGNIIKNTSDNSGPLTIEDLKALGWIKYIEISGITIKIPESSDIFVYLENLLNQILSKSYKIIDNCNGTYTIGSKWCNTRKK